MNRNFFIMNGKSLIFLCALLTLSFASGCHRSGTASTFLDYATVTNQLVPGMSKSAVISRLGPPTSAWSPNTNEEYLEYVCKDLSNPDVVGCEVVIVSGSVTSILLVRGTIPEKPLVNYDSPARTTNCSGFAIYATEFDVTREQMRSGLNFLISSGRVNPSNAFKSKTIRSVEQTSNKLATRITVQESDVKNLNAFTQTYLGKQVIFTICDVPFAEAIIRSPVENGTMRISCNLSNAHPALMSIVR